MESQRPNTLLSNNVILRDFFFFHLARWKMSSYFAYELFSSYAMIFTSATFFLLLFFAPRQIINLFNHLMYAYFLISRHVIRSLTAVRFQLFQWGSVVENLKIVILLSDLIPTKFDIFFFCKSFCCFMKKKNTQQVQPSLSVFVYIYFIWSYRQMNIFFSRILCVRKVSSRSHFFFLRTKQTHKSNFQSKSACFS